MAQIGVIVNNTLKKSENRVKMVLTTLKKLLC